MLLAETVLGKGILLGIGILIHPVRKIMRVKLQNNNIINLIFSDFIIASSVAQIHSKNKEGLK